MTKCREAMFCGDGVVDVNIVRIIEVERGDGGSAMQCLRKESQMVGSRWLERFKGLGDSSYDIFYVQSLNFNSDTIHISN